MNPASTQGFAAAPTGPVVVFDGVCALCGGWVRFVLRHDRRACFRFAAMQTPAGTALMEAHGLDPRDPVSFLLVDRDAAWHDSDGVIEVLRRLGGPWRGAVLARVVPRAWRDRAYRLLARNRYRLFGSRPTCMAPPPGTRDRFL